jgi:hypothetical protein
MRYRLVPHDMGETPASAGGVERDGDVKAADTTIRVYDGDQFITEVRRTTTKPIARFKVAKPEPPRRGAQP